MFCNGCGRMNNYGVAACTQCGFPMPPWTFSTSSASSVPLPLNTSSTISPAMPAAQHVSTLSTDSTLQQGSQTSLVDMSSWLEMKSKERQSHFRPKRKGLRPAVEDKVITQVGLMTSRGKVLRGTRVCVRVPRDCSPSGIVDASLRQMAVVHGSSPEGNHVLCYINGTPVVYLPDTRQPFSLSEYKQIVLKDYAKIVLFLKPDLSDSDDSQPSDMAGHEACSAAGSLGVEETRAVGEDAPFQGVYSGYIRHAWCGVMTKCNWNFHDLTMAY